MQKPQRPAEGELAGKNERDALLMRMRKAVDALSASPGEEFDAVAHCMILVHDSATLLELLFGRDKLKEWMENDDPRFHRFASRLKMSLEQIRGYLNSVSALFAPGGDVVRQKITAAQREIEAVLEMEGSLLKEGELLFEQENALRESQNRLSALMRKKNELAAIAEQLSGVDIEALAGEVEAGEEARCRLEEEYAPLREKKAELAREAAVLTEAVRNLGGEIDRLQAATDEEARRLAASIPGWIEQIRSCTARRGTEEQGRLQELEREMAVFKGVERQVRQHVREIHACIASARAQRELLQAHFHSSRSPGQRSSRSLVDMKDCLAGLISKIEVNLAELDAALQDMEQQLAAAAARV